MRGGEGREGRKKTFYIVFREEEREDEWLQWQDDGVWMNMRGGRGGGGLAVGSIAEIAVLPMEEVQSRMQK